MTLERNFIETTTFIQVFERSKKSLSKKKRYKTRKTRQNDKIIENITSVFNTKICLESKNLLKMHIPRWTKM